MRVKKPRILFRTAGGRAKGMQLGLGHVFRSINLAEKLRKNYDINFLIEDFGGIEKILKNNNFFAIKKIKKDVDLKHDIEITNKTIEKINADLLIVDRYNVKKKYLKTMKRKIKTVFITDLKNFDYDVDLLINGFIGFKNQIKKNKFGAKCFLGPKYQILNKEFQNQNIKRKSGTKILITFGGYDEKQISSVVVTSLKQFLNKMQFKIILGPAAKITNELSTMSRKYPDKIIIQKNVKNMYQEISKSNFGICSGGLTTYEFASVGIPFATICDEKHQLITANEWEKRKIAVNLGLLNKNTKKDIRLVFEKMLRNEIKLKTGRKFVDGLGTKRVSNEILKI